MAVDRPEVKTKACAHGDISEYESVIPLFPPRISVSPVFSRKAAVMDQSTQIRADYTVFARRSGRERAHVVSPHKKKADPVSAMNRQDQ